MARGSINVTVRHEGVLGSALSASRGTIPGEVVTLLGSTAEGDSGAGLARWDATSEAAEDGNDVWGTGAPGRWLRITTVGGTSDLNSVLAAALETEGGTAGRVLQLSGQLSQLDGGHRQMLLTTLGGDTVNDATCFESASAGLYWKIIGPARPQMFGCVFGHAFNLTSTPGTYDGERKIHGRNRTYPAAAGTNNGWLFQWDASSTASTSDTVIQATGTPTGRWLYVSDAAAANVTGLNAFFAWYAARSAEDPHAGDVVDWSGIWCIDDTVTLTGADESNFKSGKLVVVRELDIGLIVTAYKATHSDFIRVVGVVENTTNYDNRLITRACVRVYGRNGTSQYEGFYTDGSKKWGVEISDEYDEFGVVTVNAGVISSDLGLINAWNCGSAGPNAGSWSQTWSYTARSDTGTTNSVNQRTVLTVPSMSEYVHKSASIYVEASGWHSVEAVDYDAKTITIYPWLRIDKQNLGFMDGVYNEDQETMEGVFDGEKRFHTDGDCWTWDADSVAAASATVLHPVTAGYLSGIPNGRWVSPVANNQSTGVVHSAHGGGLYIYSQDQTGTRLGLYAQRCGAGVLVEGAFGGEIRSFVTQTTGASFVLRGINLGTTVSHFHPETPAQNVDFLAHKTSNYEQPTTFQGMSVYRPKKWIQLNPLSSSGGAYSEGQRGMPSVLILDNTPLGRQYGVQPRRNDEGTFISLTTKPGHNLGLTTRYQTAPTIYLGFDFEADRLIGAKEIAFIRGGNLAGGGAATTFSVALADSEIAAGRTLMKSVQGRTSTDQSNYTLPAFIRPTKVFAYYDYLQTDWRVFWALDGAAPELQKTVITPGTTGNATIYTAYGRVNFAAGGATTLTVTNPLAKTTSAIMVQFVEAPDTTATKVWVPAASRLAGSFVININAAATAETAVEFVIL
jgi:hypothetical protein